MPIHASQMYSKNISNFLLLMIKDAKLHLDLEDEIIRETMVTRDGEVVQPKIRELLGLKAPPRQVPGAADTVKRE